MRKAAVLSVISWVMFGLGSGALAQENSDAHDLHELASGAPDPMEMGLTGAEAAEWVDIENDPEEGELKMVIGPVDLGSTEGHHNIKQPPLLTVKVPTSGYLYRFDFHVEDGKGNPIPNDVLHHVNLIDPDNRELFSPVPRRLFAAGSETQSAGMPKVLGVPLKEGQRLMISSMFHNPTGKEIPEAYLHITLKYREEGWIFPIKVHPVYLDVMGHVGAKSFDLPPGVSEMSWEGSPAISGRLLGAGGHLHEYATTLRFEDVTTGEVLWETGPVLDEQGNLETVPIGKFWWKGGIKLEDDHTYRLTVVYDNPTGETIPNGGMGVLGGVFKPAGDEEWPSADVTDPDYIANMKETAEMARLRHLGLAGHGGHEASEPEEKGSGESGEHQHGSGEMHGQ